MTNADELFKTPVQCDFCRLLLKIVSGKLPKEMTTEPLWIRRKGSKITVQRGPQIYRLLTIRQLPGMKLPIVHMIGLRRLTFG
jgi:hypothetical protein